MSQATPADRVKAFVEREVDGKLNQALSKVQERIEAMAEDAAGRAIRSAEERLATVRDRMLQEVNAALDEARTASGSAKEAKQSAEAAAEELRATLGEHAELLGSFDALDTAPPALPPPAEDPLKGQLAEIKRDNGWPEPTLYAEDPMRPTIAGTIDRVKEILVQVAAENAAASARIEMIEDGLELEIGHEGEDAFRAEMDRVARILGVLIREPGDDEA